MGNIKKEKTDTTRKKSAKATDKCPKNAKSNNTKIKIKEEASHSTKEVFFINYTTHTRTRMHAQISVTDCFHLLSCYLLYQDKCCKEKTAKTFHLMITYFLKCDFYQLI